MIKRLSCKYSQILKLSNVICLLLITVLCSLSFAQDEEDGEAGEVESFNAKISLPWSDFKQLLDKVRKDTVQNVLQQELPAQYVLSEATFIGKPENDQECIFSAQLSVNVLDAKAYIEIPLGRGLSMYPGVTVNDRAGSTGLHQDGTSYIFLHGKGKYHISYRFLASVTYNSGKFTTSFPLPGQAASRITMDLGSDQFSVWANERPLSLMKSGGNRFMYEGGLGSSTDAIVTWQQTVNSQGTKDALVSSTLNTIYSIASDVIKINSQINFNIVHNTIREFSFFVPPSVDIIDVSGNSIATWETADSADSRFVTAFLKYDVKDNVSFLLHAEMNCPDSVSDMNLPAVTMLNVIRQEGLIGVGVLNSIEINPLDHSNNVLMRDKRELPEWFSDQGEVIHVYQYLSDNYKIALELVRHKNISVLNALITSADIKSMIREDGKMVSTVELHVRNRGEQFLRVQWKKEYQLWSVYSNGEPSRPSIDSLTNELLIPLKRASDRTIENSIQISWLSKQKSFKNLGSQEIIYPEFNIPVQKLSGALFLPEYTKPLFVKGPLFSDVSERKQSWITSRILNENYYTAFSVNSLFQRKLVSGFPADAHTSEFRGSQTRSKKLSNDKMNLDTFSGMINSMAQRRDYETGILSIPVQIDFEGICVPYRAVMFKKDETPYIKFMYYHLLPTVKNISGVIVFLLMFSAAVALTSSIYLKFSWKFTAFIILLPLTVSLLLKRLCSEPLNIDLLFSVPAVFLLYLTVRKVIDKIRNDRATEKDTSSALKTEADAVFRDAFSTEADMAERE